MNTASGKNLSVSLVIPIFLYSTLSAATVFTQSGRIDGAITQQDSKKVVVKPAKGADVTLEREQIVTIYDDEANLIWTHPSIAKTDPTPEAPNKVEIANTDLKSNYRGLHIGLAGGYGIGYGNATFSTYPLSTGPDYRSVIEINATAAWYYSESAAVTFGVGGTERAMPVKGINAVNLGAQGNGYWPMQFVDLRTGYRLQADFLFVEAGLLWAIKTKDVPLTIETATANVTGTATGTTLRSFGAISLALGVNFPVQKNFYIFTYARVDHGVSSAVTMQVATATDTNGNAISTAPLSIVPLQVTLQLGASWRL